MSYSNLSDITKEEAAVIRQNLRQWYRKNARDLPWRRTQDPYAILVSEYMLQQTTVAAATPYYMRWMERFPSVFELARSSEQTVLRYWQGLGYYSRAKNLLKTAIHLVKNYRGRFPTSPRELQELPGIGPYTAGAVAAFAFDLPCVVLDANIIRVIARITNYTGPIDTKAGRDHIESIARLMLPLRDGRLHTSSLMELGATVCTARSPQCLMCPIKDHCRATEPDRIPKKSHKPSAEKRTRLALFHVAAGRILLQKSRGPHWKGLWTLPHLSDEPVGAALLTEETYTVTRFNTVLRVYEVDPELMPPLPEGCHYIQLDRLAEHPMPSPHRRVINRLVSLEHCLA